MRKVLGCSVIALVLAGILLGTAGWSVWTYHRLVRDELSLEQRWSEVQGAAQHRLDLVPAAIVRCRATGGAGVEAIEEARRGRERARQSLDAPRAFENPEALADVVLAQDRLGRVLSRLAACHAETETDLRERDAAYERAVARFDAAVAAYNAALGRMPRSLVARICGMRGKCMLRNPSHAS